jgi:hypothetical protein
MDPELAVELGPLLQRLHPLLGPFRGQNQGGEPELEGLDDLRCRGSYQHLLASEWLLAQDMPDEFLRRATNGEHMFLAARPRARRADRSIIALFDSGPLQLGAPRLAHIALWILLARRAQQAQGAFRWGSLQSPGELLEARTIDSLRTLLHRRTFTSTDAVTLARWRAVLDEQQAGGELWLIGPPLIQSEPQAAPLFTHRVVVQKDLQGTALEASLLERGTERSVCLPLPEPGVAVSLVRGAFRHGAPPVQCTTDGSPVVSLTRPPVLSFDGTRVCLAMRDEPGALVFRVPRSARDQPAAPRYERWSAGYSVLAMSLIGRRLGALLSNAHQLRFWGTPLTVMPCPTQEQFHAPGTSAVWLPLAWLRSAAGHRVCVVDQSRRLLCWDSGVAERTRALGLQLRPELLEDDVLGMAEVSNGLLIYAHHADGAVWLRLLGLKGAPLRPQLLCSAPRDASVLFQRRNSCAVRVEQHPMETWAIGQWSLPGVVVRVQLPAGSRAIGLMQEPDHGRMALIALAGDILRLHFADGGNELLYAAPDGVASCTACPGTGVVAMLTKRRQLIVVSAATREVRLSVQTARQSHADA